jgi:hypothetical protein
MANGRIPHVAGPRARPNDAQSGGLLAWFCTSKRKKKKMATAIEMLPANELQKSI